MEYYGIFREISRELLGLGNDLNKRFNYVENLYSVCFFFLFETKKISKI